MANESSARTSTASAAATRKTVRRSRARFGILALLAIGTMINYLDRTVLGIAAPQLTNELGISAAVMGVMFSAFSWTYVAAQIPGGMFLDRFGTKLTYYLSMTLWSLATLLQGFVTGVGTLLACRLGLGVAESPCFPANSRVVATWFPQKERAMATGTYTVGEYIGLACFSPLLFALMGEFGWRALFYVVGAAGMLFGGIWWLFYREPRDHPGANAAELEYIEAGGGLTNDPASDIEHGAKAKPKFEWRTIGRLLKHRQLAGICFGQFAGNSTLVFFLTWFPTYLATERHMGWLKIGFFAILPFIAASVGVMFGGVLSDWLLARGKSANVAQAADHRGPPARLDDRARQLRGKQRGGYRDPVGGVLRAGHGRARLDARVGHRAGGHARRDGRHLQPRREPRGHHHAARGRLHRRGDRVVRRRPRLHRHDRAARRAVVYLRGRGYQAHRAALIAQAPQERAAQDKAARESRTAFSDFSRRGA